MPFSGFKGKNEKEIYEGDIARIANLKAHWMHGEPRFDWRVFQIRFKGYVWSFSNDRLSIPLWDRNDPTLAPYCEPRAFPDECEVIGNIWENPQLLK
jgi:uncharacterized phage protein (TIGR01671 family)